jgi:hypothetical protein
LLAVLFLLPTLSARSQYDSGNFDYTIKPSDIGGGKTRIEVVEAKTATLAYTIVLEDVYTDHVHAYEFHNGNLYVIHRTGGPDGYQKYPKTWTDSLWRYDKDKNGVMIYSERGLDFRVSPNEKHIAIVAGNSLFILNERGTKIREFKAEDFHLEGLDTTYITDQFLFFPDGGPGAPFEFIIKMNLGDFTWSRHDLPDLSFDFDYSFNPFNEMVVGSEYPFFYEEEYYNSWVKDKPTVILYLYDFRSKKKSVLAHSRAKEFHPRWIDTNHVEFDDPLSSKRIIREIKQ